MAKKFVEDGTGLKAVKLDELICRDCKYKILQSVSQCTKYETKRAFVFTDNSCPFFEKEPD